MEKIIQISVIIFGFIASTAIGLFFYTRNRKKILDDGGTVSKITEITTTMERGIDNATRTTSEAKERVGDAIDSLNRSEQITRRIENSNKQLKDTNRELEKLIDSVRKQNE